MTPTAKAPGIRERNRREITAEILSAAQTQLTLEGVPGLSLRSISRDMGMASSAIYRYFSSRDELLTAVLVEAYKDLARAVADGDESVRDRQDYASRWMAICHSMRDWALADPQRWGLLYGTPVTGYNAPQDTVEWAAAVGKPLLRLAADAGLASGDPDETGVVNAQFAKGPEGDDKTDKVDYITSVGAWSHLIGLISLETFGHLKNVVDDLDQHFVLQMEKWARSIQNPH